MSGKYKDESKAYEINLEAATWSMGEALQDKFKAAGSFLNAVDWIVEIDNALLLIEFKNYSRPETIIEHQDSNQGAKRKFRDKLYENVLRKYYFSSYYLFACGQRKVVNYVLVVETPNLDSVIGKRAQASIQRRLPFDLQNNAEITGVLIDFFKVLSISDWNELYPMFPLYKCSNGPTPARHPAV